MGTVARSSDKSGTYDKVFFYGPSAIPALETADGHSSFLMGVTLEYGFHSGALTVAPGVGVDYGSEEVLFVAGIALSVGF